MITVVKRDGKKEVPYSVGKVQKAISNAFADTDNKMPNWIVDEVDKAIHKTGKEKIQVEEIQDIVEDILMDSPFKKEAKEYIRWRGK